MTIDYIVLGKLPISEQYPEDKKFREKYKNKVVVAYLNQLKRCFPCFPDRFALQEIEKDSGNYHVAIDFIDEQQFEYAKNVADELPYCWDEEAQKELGKDYFKELKEIICKAPNPKNSSK